MALAIWATTLTVEVIALAAALPLFEAILDRVLLTRLMAMDSSSLLRRVKKSRAAELSWRLYFQVYFLDFVFLDGVITHHRHIQVLLACAGNFRNLWL